VATTRRENGHRQDNQQALKYGPKGKRSIGRLRKRWKDQLYLEGYRTDTTSNTSQLMMIMMMMMMRRRRRRRRRMTTTTTLLL
jgi:hypothetical protein